MTPNQQCQSTIWLHKKQHIYTTRNVLRAACITKLVTVMHLRMTPLHTLSCSMVRHRECWVVQEYWTYWRYDCHDIWPPAAGTRVQLGTCQTRWLQTAVWNETGSATPAVQSRREHQRCSQCPTMLLVSHMHTLHTINYTLLHSKSISYSITPTDKPCISISLNIPDIFLVLPSTLYFHIHYCVINCWLIIIILTRAVQPVATCRQSPYLH